MSRSNPIFVTQPYLPPLADFLPLLEGIWERKVLTNNGQLHTELEERLCEFLKVEYLSLFSNGTLALIAALKALDVKGEVVTTPYSFVATAHSLLWNDITPVFVDVDARSYNIDPRKIEAAVTDKTTAILPVHCYGRPCEVDAVEEIANKYGLAVIYDAAHAFGVECHCGSILSHGDLSILSFHATKVFNTFEGGAVVCSSSEMKERLDNLKNFGFTDEITVSSLGINAKMSEVNAAMGLLQLQHMPYVFAQRRKIHLRYKAALQCVRGIEMPVDLGEAKKNYSYFPVLVNPEYGKSRDELYQHLAEHGVYTRRYFYPLISNFPMYRGFLPPNPKSLSNAEGIANSVLCLPIYPDMSDSDQDYIINLLKNN